MNAHNKNFTLYCSYYDSNQIEQYNVKETENIKLLNIFIEIKDNEYSLDLLKKFHNKNIYSNFGTILYHTNNIDIKNDIIQHTDWYNLDRLKFINEATDDIINLNINQYIDVNNPYDLNINNKYSIKLINA